MLVWLASQAHAARMIDHGIQILLYPSGFLHTKAILVDHKIAGIGTVNFDNRSFRINFEVTLWFTHHQAITDVEEMLSADFATGEPLTDDEVKAKPFMTRFMGEAARLLSPLL
jgi:cardiolipin synthase